MTQPIAGWYTDPAGDTTKLRYWDGTKWTDSLMEAPSPQASNPPTNLPNATDEPVLSTASSELQATPTTTAEAAVTAVEPQAQSAQTVQPAQSQSTAAYDAAYQQAAGQPMYTEAPPAAQSAQASQPGAPAQTVVSQDTYAPIYVNYGDMPLYYVSPQDTTLRLVAFILALVSTITMGFVIIPLAWMIPMTVMTWQIYKGKRANTVGFDVCSLIFLNLVSGILLLVSTKEE